VFGRLYTMSDNLWQVVFRRVLQVLPIFLAGVVTLNPDYGFQAAMIADKTECRPADPKGRVAVR